MYFRRKKHNAHGSNNNNNTNTNSSHSNTSTTRPPEGVECIAIATVAVATEKGTTTATGTTQQLSNQSNRGSNSYNNNNTNNDNHLAEVLVVNDTKIDAMPQAATGTAPPNVTYNVTAIENTNNHSNGNNEDILAGRCNVANTTKATNTIDNNAAPVIPVAAAAIAPIACIEDVEVDCNESIRTIEKRRAPLPPNTTTTTAIQVQQQLTAKIQTAVQSPPNKVEQQNVAVVRRSKSRVRTYLKKCKDRLTGQYQLQYQQQQQQQQQQPQELQHPNQQEQQQEVTQTLAFTMMQPTCQQTTEYNSNNNNAANAEQQITATTTQAMAPACGEPMLMAADCLLPSLSAVQEEQTIDEVVNVHEVHEDEVPCSYADINFRLSAVMPHVTILSNNSNDDHDDVDDDDDEDEDDYAAPPLHAIKVGAPDFSLKELLLVKEAQLARAQEMESGLASLIDTHLAHIYPVYFESTRATLIHQARDLLVCSYRGCLESLEQKFLCKYAEIAAELKERHVLGASLIWQQGWPLVTPTGELILHLGDLDDSLLQPADLYLCVKTVNNFETTRATTTTATLIPAATKPKLYAIWRSTHNESNIKHQHCIEFSNEHSKANYPLQLHQKQQQQQHLSIITLEMLSDELPQLLQNLLVGVERTIERISLNELQMTNANNNNSNSHSEQQQQQPVHLKSLTADETNNNNNNNNGLHNITNSPKCALKRSELITKNKLLSNKYMLRRLTNRQDSMNSTSSGNSCGSSGSTSSDELGYYHNKNNNNNNNNANQTSISPAMPLFCLGSSFPHIDSDEENSDEKRNSMESDQFENKIVPPTSINEIPEKLLTSGIYLPGTRDLRGQPIVTVDAKCVLEAGLNCYEIATVLLFYSTIPESTSINSNLVTATNTVNNVATVQQQQQHLKQQQLKQSSIESTATSQQPQIQQQQPPPQQQQQQQQNAIIPNNKPAQQQTFTILITIENSHHLCVIDLICQSLKLLTRQVTYCEILGVCLEKSLLELCCKNDTNKVVAAATTTTTTAAVTMNGDNNNSNCIGNNKKLQQQQQQQEPQQQQQQQQQQQHLVKFISVDEVTTSVATSQIPHGKLQGLHHHDVRKWREFFSVLEPFQSQCLLAGQRLVAAMSDIRSADLQGLPTRRQLYAQHRALSRALMDSELHNLRKRGSMTLTCLQELAKNINAISSNNNNNGKTKLTITTPTKLTTVTTTSSTALTNHNSINYSFNNMRNSHMSNGSHHSKSAMVTSSNASSAILTTTTPSFTEATNRLNSNNNIDVAIRLQKVTLLFNEVDRAAKRLEQLTEQRRERLRELTRQRALEDEINEVTSWITSDGNETLQRFSNVPLDCESAVKDHEQEFEKYYFISMKHLAKGRDLYDAASNIEALRESATNLKTALDCFAEKLEHARERIEGASRLHHLIKLHLREESVQQEMQRLAEQIGMLSLVEKYRQQHHHQQQLQQQQQLHQAETEHDKEKEKYRDANNSAEIRNKPNSLNLNLSARNSMKSQVMLLSSTPTQQHMSNTSSSSNTNTNRSSHRSSSGISSFEGPPCHCWRESRNLEDMDEMLDHDDDDNDGEEEQSKIADSGLGGCERCEGNPKLTRICSCQSLNEAANLYDKSHNSDELDDDCFERPSKRYLDIHSPLEANAHLQCHASSLELPQSEELNCLDPKIQKTLLLIMREMIGTERDYVRSLYYVIENYVDELLRDDIPQLLRGQRNVIFGNIEKIFEFHNSHFLRELEQYERHPLKVGAAFLQMESKFYLYALYNKNKPKSDSLMSECGTSFFKSKQMELNDKMDLASYLLKPVQRMGKYALLLQQLVKACNSVEGDAKQEIAADVEELHRAEEMVKFQLRHGNDLLAMDSLRDCDVNVKEQGRLLRQNEFLVWQGRAGKKTLRQIFLFEELVLFSKARRFPDHKNLDLYIYKNSIKTADIGLTAHVGDSPTKFEIWFRKRKPEDTWTLQCMSEDIKKAWTEEISTLLWKQAKRNREIRLAEMSSMGIGSKPCLDIRPSTNQINDRSITITQLNKAPRLRHSFMGIQTEHSKSTRRPNSLISESSLSSGTSSSSLSTGSSSGGHERLSGLSKSNSNNSSNNNHGLELINETQTLMLSNVSGTTCNSNNNNISNRNSTSSSINSNNNSNNSNNNDIGTSLVSGNLRNHKRSTTLVSQLSMESGIMSDISMTPEQEQPEPTSTTWTTAASYNTTMSTKPTSTNINNNNSTTTSTATVVMRRQKYKITHKDCKDKEQSIFKSDNVNNDTSNNPYLKQKDEESIDL